MRLDVYTLFVCELYVLAFLGIIMVFAWRGAQYNRVLGFNCLSLLLSIVAVGLSSLRSSGMMFLPIVVGNLLILCAYGLQLNAFRALRGARFSWLWIMSLTLWAGLCLLPGFYYSLSSRILLSALLCMLFTSAMIYELQRARSLLPVTWWPAQLLLGIHLTFNVTRALLDGGIPSPLHGAIGGSTFSVYVILESILVVIGLSFTMMAMVNERTQIVYRQASLLDPLTGVWNRRALFEKTRQLATSGRCSQQPLAVMLFDLDHFKTINDRFGHSQGDRVLTDFCRQVAGQLPPDSYFARLGGEEFAAVVMCSEEECVQVAERIRQAVEHSCPENVRYSVSIGVASCSPERENIENLMTAADEALYQAKAAGRNQVKTFGETLSGLEGRFLAG
ncbi:GGDEF domain-containing protein [Erwinia persicina]|uniref:GGDEF domain-containing protein n=1 Tax=Erwinia persicina TaxID=55211 RepID=UPI00177C9D74|nr:GGDEF domain-containing protein [Erwinia persicina]MBD8212683.1 GGDEF domain-containing protein [Erwinia persicina]